MVAGDLTERLVLPLATIALINHAHASGPLTASLDSDVLIDRELPLGAVLVNAVPDCQRVVELQSNRVTSMLVLQGFDFSESRLEPSGCPGGQRGACRDQGGDSGPKCAAGQRVLASNVEREQCRFQAAGELLGVRCEVRGRRVGRLNTWGSWRGRRHSRMRVSGRERVDSCCRKRVGKSIELGHWRHLIADG